MAHDTPTIEASTRDRIGTRYAKRLRQAGRLPAIVYGHQQNPVSIHVDEKATLTYLKHGAHLFNVHIDGSASETCLVKELQFGYLGDNVVHIDFARVDLDEEVEVAVHLRFVGEPIGAKKPGAVVSTDLTDLEIVCKAGAIPDEIRVDISGVEETFTVGELTLPAGVRTDIDPETPVIHIEIVAEEAEGEEVQVEGEAEPEVIGGKKDEEETESEA